MVDTAFKTRENRSRRAARRQGLRLVKSRARDTRAVDYALYALVEVRTGRPVVYERVRFYCMTIEDVESYLDTPPAERERAS
jgi:hypothetical protein